MKNPTKDILTEELIEKDLYDDNKKDLRELPLFFAISIIFSLLMTPLSLFADSMLLCVFGILIGNLPLLIALFFLIISLVERKKLSRGEFQTVTRPLMRKKARHYWGKYRSGTYRYLYFDGFHRKLVDHSTFEHASTGRECYLIHYKKSRLIKLVYPTNAYELKETSSLNISDS